jgi:uncharacterized membrane protein
MRQRASYENEGMILVVVLTLTAIAVCVAAFRYAHLYYAPEDGGDAGGVTSFFFNTVLLALAVNVAAGYAP